MKFGIKQLKSPTPKKCRRFGLALLAVSAFMAGTGALTSPAIWQLIVFLIGATGTFVAEMWGGNNMATYRSFVQKHISSLSSDKTVLTVKTGNTEAEYLDAGFSFPPESTDAVGNNITPDYIQITALTRPAGDNIYKIDYNGSETPPDEDGLLMPAIYFSTGVVINASDLPWNLTEFPDDIYSIEVRISGVQYATDLSSSKDTISISESTNVVMEDSETKYFQKVLDYQKSQNYNPIAISKYNYLKLDGLYKSIKYAEKLNLIPTCAKLLDTFKKALV